MDNRPQSFLATFVCILLAVAVVAGAVFLAKRQAPQQQSEPTPGALTGPVINYPYLCVNGACTYFSHLYSLTAGTTSPMNIQSPAATSTLKLGSGCRFDVATSVAKMIRFAKASTPNATTTFLFGANFAANAFGSVVATTSNDNFVFGPNQWLVMSMVGGQGTDAPTAECQATFEVI